MSIYKEIMNDSYLSKQVLIHFGFGEVTPIKIERWVKKEFPNLYYQCKRAAKKDNIIPMRVEAMSKERRDSILDKEEVYRKSRLQ